MNSGKRIFTLLLAMMMLFTLAAGSLSAYADVTTNPSTIDDAKKGSITVTKYETTAQQSGYTGEGTAPLYGQLGTGSNADVGLIDTPTTYQPLEGAEFYLYQVLTTAETTAYYDGTGTRAELQLSDFYDASTRDKKTTVSAPAPWIAVTNSNGQILFNNGGAGLPVGIYLLIERSAPADITAPLSDPCLISIPMVNAAKDANINSLASDSTEWVYDVFVYPKNHTSEGTVEIHKTGTDISATEANLANVEFALQWLNETTWMDYPGVAAGDNIATTNTDGVASYSNLPAGLNGRTYRIVETNAPAGYIIDRTPIVFTVNTDNTITCNNAASTNLKLEYKKADNTYADLLPGGKTDSNTTLRVTIDNEKPDLTKQVKKNEDDSWVTTTQYNIGDTIDYKLTVKVPDIIEDNNFAFSITDNPQGLKDNLACVVKYINNSSVETSFNVTATSYGENGFEINFRTNTSLTDYLDDIAGKTITIEYSAVLTKDATIAGTGNMNTATLVYSHFINNDPNYPAPTDPTENVTITDKNVVYTYQIDFTKWLDNATTGTKGVGVQFVLYKHGETTPVSLILDNSTGNINTYRPTVGTEDSAEFLETASEGKIIIKGLEEGSYDLKETKTIQGYNLLTSVLTFTINESEDHAWDDCASNPTFSGQTLNKKSADPKDNNRAVDTSSATKTIVNRKGFVLPQTGSMGYLVFCAAGITLVVGGALILFGGRKKKIQ